MSRDNHEGPGKLIRCFPRGIPHDAVISQLEIPQTASSFQTISPSQLFLTVNQTNEFVILEFMFSTEKNNSG